MINEEISQCVCEYGYTFDSIFGNCRRTCLLDTEFLDFDQKCTFECSPLENKQVNGF